MRKIIKVILSITSVVFMCYATYQIGAYLYGLVGDSLFGRIFLAVVFIIAFWLGLYFMIKLFTDDTMQMEGDECEKQKELQ